MNILQQFRIKLVILKQLTNFFNNLVYHILQIVTYIETGKQAKLTQYTILFYSSSLDNQIIVKYKQIRMSNKFDQAMQQRFNNDLNNNNSNGNHANAENSDDDNNSQQSQDYYEYERKKMEAALSMLKTRQNNSILDELKKNTNQEIEHLDQFQDQVTDLHNITRNNQRNVLEQSIIKEIKEKVFNQSMMHTIQLADLELEKKKSKHDQEIEAAHQHERHKNKENGKQVAVDSTQDKLNRKIERVKMEREMVEMAREDQLSMKYEQKVLSNFFAQRFFTPTFDVPQNKNIQIAFQNYAPKTTFTNLKPLPNTESNVLPRNAPELALRRLGRSKKITFVSSSMSEVPVKYKKLNPELDEGLQPQKQNANIDESENTIIQSMQQYVNFLKPLIPDLQTASRNYRPQFINEYRNQKQQNFNIDSQQNSKSISDCLDSQKPETLKQIKLTFEHINSLQGINKFKNIQNAALQYNAILSLNSIEGCQKLIQLNLSHNKIKSIDSIRDLKFLRLLNIEHNMIGMLQLKGGSLQILYASHNRIQQIVDLSANVYLRRLNVSNNNLHGLGGLKNLHYLQEINANNNYLTSLDGLQHCLLLRTLFLQNNRLTSLHPNFLYIFLNRLHLSYNSLANLSNMLLPSLQQLYIDHNKIQRIQHKSQQKQKNKNNTKQNIILYLPNLKIINLDQNKLEGFCTVWAFIRYSTKLQTVKYDQNQYFVDLRQKVRELYEHIIYRNMNKLSLLNQAAYDIGIKKYYEGVYNNYLAPQKYIFKKQSPVFQQIHKKIIFTIQQNQCISRLEDKKIKFSQTETFVRHKSVTKAEDLIQIIQFLSNIDQNRQKKQECKILQATRSIFYEHDKFQYGLRASLNKIRSLIVAKSYRIAKRGKYFKSQKPKLSHLIKYLENYILMKRLSNIVKIFHLPLERMGQQKAAIIIQKNWRCFRMRRKYLKIIKKLKVKDVDSELEDFDMDDYDFDKYQIPQFQLQLPEDMDFDQFIIRPQIFQMLDTRQQRRNQMIENRSNVNTNRNANQMNSNSNAEGGQRPGQMMNNFMENNQSRMNNTASSLQQKIEKLMRQWGVSREGAMILINKQKQKEARKKKEADKNMSATERYQKFKRGGH